MIIILHKFDNQTCVLIKPTQSPVGEKVNFQKNKIKMSTSQLCPFKAVQRIKKALIGLSNVHYDVVTGCEPIRVPWDTWTQLDKKPMTGQEKVEGGGDELSSHDLIISAVLAF